VLGAEWGGDGDELRAIASGFITLVAEMAMLDFAIP